MGKPTNQKANVKRSRVKRSDDDDPSVFDVRGMDADRLAAEVVGRHFVEALESRDLDRWKRGVAMYYAAQGWGTPTFQTNAAIRGKSPASDASGDASDKERRARLMYETVGEWLGHCGCQADDFRVAIGLLGAFVLSGYMFDCHPEAPTWRDVADFYDDTCAAARGETDIGDLVRGHYDMSITAIAIALEIAPIRRRHERPNVEKITRATARVLGMSRERINQLFPGLWTERDDL